MPPQPPQSKGVVVEQVGRQGSHARSYQVYGNKGADELPQSRINRQAVAGRLGSIALFSGLAGWRKGRFSLKAAARYARDAGLNAAGIPTPDEAKRAVSDFNQEIFEIQNNRQLFGRGNRRQKEKHILALRRLAISRKPVSAYVIGYEGRKPQVRHRVSGPLGVGVDNRFVVLGEKARIWFNPDKDLRNMFAVRGQQHLTLKEES